MKVPTIEKIRKLSETSKSLGKYLNASLKLKGIEVVSVNCECLKSFKNIPVVSENFDKSFKDSRKIQICSAIFTKLYEYFRNLTKHFISAINFQITFKDLRNLLKLNIFENV